MLSHDVRPSIERAPPLVLLHGFLGEPSDWDAVAADLAVERRVVRVDLLKAQVPQASVAAFADAVAAGLRAAGLAPARIVGYSLGGRIALALAARHADVVARVLAVSATPGLEDEEERSARAAADDALAAALERDGIEAFIDRWYAQPLFASLRSHPDYGLVSRRRAGGSSAAWARVLRDASPGRTPPLWDELPHLAARTSLAVGSLDAKYLDLARRAVERAPALRVDVVEGAGHAVHLERPTALAARIDALLS
jgi:2-succinyl-6-hydroxy-2,4-cyclohexadiene-1-carboxylate synthase